MLRRRKYRLIVMTITSMILILFGSISFAWIVLVNKTDSFIATAAKVDVDYQIYLGGVVNVPEFQTLYEGSSVVKSGIYAINVSDVNADNYIDRLRMDVRINSTVDTYVRIKIIDALTLATLDYNGLHGEVSIVDQPINYAFQKHFYVNGVYYEDLIDAETALGGITAEDEVVPVEEWFDNYVVDGYYYYPAKIERDMTSLQLTIPFIEAYDGDSFTAKSLGYSLQIAVIVEAIQAEHDAPIITWGLATPPWGGSWS